MDSFPRPSAPETPNKGLLSKNTCICADRNDILIVDDNVFNIVTLQTLLEYQFNLESDKAMNGQEAIEKV